MNQNKKTPPRMKKRARLNKQGIMLIVLSAALVLVITALIILLNVWKGKPENQESQQESSSQAESSVPEPVESEPEPEPVITDVDFGSSDYTREFFADDLFIGDSIATGFTDYIKLDEKNVAASVSLTPYKAHSGSISLPDGTTGAPLVYAKEMQPKRIFLMMGFNGLNASDAMEGSFRALMEKLEEACPNAVIYCYSITPLTADSKAAASVGITNADVDSFNEYLKGLTSELGVIYLDINSKMSDDSGYLKSDYNESDGMHISAPTYDLILSYTQRYIQETPEPEPSSKHLPTANSDVSSQPEDTSAADTSSQTSQTSQPEESSAAESQTESQAEQTGSLSEEYDRDTFANDLFIGDSISTGLSAYGILSPKNVAAAVGYTPYKAYNTDIPLGDGTSGTAFDYAVSMQPKRIFIMLGSNAITTASAMEDSYRTLLEKLADKCPDSTVYVMSVTPVTSDSSSAAAAGITNTMITDFNKFLKALADEKGLTYIDLYSLLSDDNGYFLHDYAEKDGLHFKGATYKVMLSYIESLL